MANTSRAVIFYSTGDLTYNTSAPSGSLADSGWQWVGLWASCQGAVIGPHHFLTAQHVGGTVGDFIVFNGVSYPSIAFHDDTSSDLRIVEISGTFPTWAPLYRSSDEVGKGLVVFGTGDGRGTDVTVRGSLSGWQWGTGRGTLRWGQNTVASAVNGGTYWGALLYAVFDPTLGVNVAHLGSGDSGGPVFINDGTGWKLAGIAAAVDGPFSTSNTGSNSFQAALFDARGLYYNNNGTWQLISGASPVRSGFYASRVSVHVAWIDSIVPPIADNSDVPALSPWQMALLGSLLLASGGVFVSRSRKPVVPAR